MWSNPHETVLEKSLIASKDFPSTHFAETSDKNVTEKKTIPNFVQMICKLTYINWSIYSQSKAYSRQSAAGNIKDTVIPKNS